MTENLNVLDYPNLLPFIEGKDSKFLSYLLAYSHRRGQARNAAAKFGMGMAMSPPFVAGADVDVVTYYNMILKSEEMDKASTHIYETLQERQIRAELIIGELRENSKLTIEEKHDLVVELEELEADIERMTKLLEELSGD